jgi:hypothetical protein
MASIPPEQLLIEIDELIRTMPPGTSLYQEGADNFSWLGRASAVIRAWDTIKGVQFTLQVDGLHSGSLSRSFAGMKAIITMLHEAYFDLRMKTAGPLTVAIGSESPFSYFDEIRKIVQMAKLDILFVDPYLDAEFVSRYLPLITTSVQVRLLTYKKTSELLPAVTLFRQQSQLNIEVRSSKDLHDRYIFIDRQACYQSGASFKDGAKKTNTTVTQITDAFSAVIAII